ncbi:MAG TPA: type III pantothenate kinase [Microthrixaceae bacterium]|mgnify:FL=1|nr:type III pantothenate kinase [Microthrixaceae bacterium]HNI35806.1 type III pantothenate kinase [Microthrixaceae bacterium]
MLLAIDVGNTQTVIGLYKSGDESHQLLDHWRIATNAVRTSDELALMFSEFLLTAGHDWRADLSGVAISSGVPSVTFELRRMCERYLDIEPVVLGTGVKTGMPVLYDNPKEVGADRIANAVGAFDLYGGPTIVVDFGTATTFDVISGAGEYLGGAIIPGIEISLDALFGRAAALRRVELVEPRSVIGKTTVESIQSGVIYGYSAMIDGMCDRIEEVIGEATVIATGGLGDLISPYTESIEHVEPWVTLHGLRLIWEKNR